MKWEKEAPRSKKIQPLCKVLDDLIDHMDYRTQVNEQQAVLQWNKIVGEKIASVTKPISINKGVLRVSVINPSWRNDLSYAKREILSELNVAIGQTVVKDIKFS